MSEIVVETTPLETVIEIEGGPVLTTTVEQELQTVIETPSTPVIIDLNSGARGEPGSAILTGDDYPTIDQGSIGDAYIITGGNDEFVGDVLQKTSLGWVNQGNIRGPVGGINSVNGHTGPDATLTKADVGLGLVDNTADLAKPVSTATQTLIDTTVKMAGAQTITGVKTFHAMPEHVTVTGDLKHTHLIAQNVPMFHDRFRFTAPVWSTSPDGVTYTPAGVAGLNVLDGRSDTSVTFTETTRYMRWYWDNSSDIQYGNVSRLVTRWGYVAGTTTDAVITVETSQDGSTWTTRGTATVASPVVKSHVVNLADNGGHNYFRVTIQINGNTGSVALLHNLEVQAYRFGSQGRGFETESPFWWNINREIGVYNHLRPMGHNVYDLGTTANRFRDIYFSGLAYGNGASLTGVALLTGAQTIAGNKTFSDVVSVGSANQFRLGTSLPTNSSLVLVGDASGYVTWGNPNMISQKAPTDANTTYRGGVYVQDSNAIGVWPDQFGVVLTAGYSADRIIQIVAGKQDTNRIKFRVGNSAETGNNGWSQWATLANDGQVVHTTGNETVAGTKTFSSPPIIPAPISLTDATNKGYVDDRINALIDAAPGALDTLNELAAAMGDDPNFATTVTNSLATKVSLTGDQTIAGIKTFSSDTYISRIRSNSGIISTTTATLGSVVGDRIITREHSHSGSTNTFRIVDMVSRRSASAADWTTTVLFTGIAIDSSYTESPLLGTGSRLKAWTMRDAQNDIISFGSAGTTYLTIGATGLIGNGSGLTALNGTNISTGTVSDARLSTNVVLLTGTQTLTGIKTFSAPPVVPDASFTIAKTSGLQIALDAKQDILTSTLLVNDMDWNVFTTNGIRYVTGPASANGPAGAPSTGQLVVLSTGGGAITQTFYPATPNGPYAYFRINYGGTWSAWRQMFDGTMVVLRIVHNGTSWPARPAGATYVEWVGPVVPTAATANDTWVNTSP